MQLLIIEKCPIEGKILSDLADSLGYSIVGISTRQTLSRIKELRNDQMFWAIQENNDPDEPSADKSNMPLSDQAWLTDVETFVEKHLDGSLLTAENLADAHAISVRHLSRKLKQLTGQNTTQYFREARLQKALEYLEGGTCTSVKSVCQRVGFHDQKYFSKLFSKRFNKRPSEFLETAKFRL